jgi:hypothetical protein
MALRECSSSDNFTATRAVLEAAIRSENDLIELLSPDTAATPRRVDVVSPAGYVRYPKRHPSVSYRTSFRGWITTDRQIASVHQLLARADGGQGASIIPASHYKCSGCNPGNRPDTRRGEVFASRT